MGPHLKNETQLPWGHQDVVYFDQQMHGRKRSKTLENDEKSTFFIMRTRGSYKAQEEKYFFNHFQIFLVIFDHANACASMRLLVEIHNTKNHAPFKVQDISNITTYA